MLAGEIGADDLGANVAGGEVHFHAFPTTLPVRVGEEAGEDLDVEIRQVNAYMALIREIGFNDPTTRRLLEDILKDTEHHAAELRDMLSKRADTKLD